MGEAARRGRYGGILIRVLIDHGLYPISWFPRPENRFSAPAIPDRTIFTRLAEVNDGADGDRPLTYSSDE
jgi:hypothetical protein